MVVEDSRNVNLKLCECVAVSLLKEDLLKDIILEEDGLERTIRIGKVGLNLLN